MKHVLRLSLSLMLSLLWLVGCAEAPIPTPEIPEEAEPLVRMARLDLAERLDTNVDEITVISVEATEFPDASLGVPEPGKSYAQVITPGYTIVLDAEGETYEYHGAEDRIVYVPEAQDE